MDSTKAIITTVLIFIGIFLITREFWCWYFKQNKIVKVLESIDKKLDNYQLNCRNIEMNNNYLNNQENSSKIEVDQEEKKEKIIISDEYIKENKAKEEERRIEEMLEREARWREQEERKKKIQDKINNVEKNTKKAVSIAKLKYKDVCESTKNCIEEYKENQAEKKNKIEDKNIDNLKLEEPKVVCYNCKSELKKGSIFCSNCGARSVEE